MLLPALTEGAATLADAGAETCPGVLEDGNGSKQDAGEERNQKGEEQDRPIDADFTNAGKSRGGDGGEDAQCGVSKAHTDGTHQDPEDAADVADDVALEWTDVGANLRVLEELDAEARRGRKGPHNDGKHACNVGVDLLEGDARHQPGETVVAEVAEVDFAAVKLERGNQGGIIPVQEMKSLRQDADDLTALAVDDDVAADRRGVSAKFAAPIAVGEHDSFEGARRVVLLGEAATQQGRNAEERESAVSDTQGGDLFGLGDARHTHGVSRVHADILHGAVLFAVDEVVGGRHVEIFELDAGRGMPDADKFIGFGIGQGLEENAFKHTEHNGVAAYASGECDESDGREHGGTAEPAQDVL